MYACLNCGYTYLGEKIYRERVDRDEKRGIGGSPIPEFHGYYIYRVCPKCNHKELIKEEDD